MPGRPPPAPRNFDRAAALYLSDYSAFPTRFRWDAAARTWRRESRSQWPAVRFERVLLAATETLEAALDPDRDLPLVFRCVHAPPDDVEHLAAITDWDSERATLAATHRAAWEATEARKRAERAALVATIAAGTAPPTAHFRLAGLDPAPYRPGHERVIGRAQRERLLAALSARAVDRAVRSASGSDALRYVPQDAPVDVDPRAWLAALPRVPGAAVLSSALYAAYRDAHPPGARPLHERAFHPLAVEVLGDGDPAACRTRRKGLRYYVDLALPSPPDGSAPDAPDAPDATDAPVARHLTLVG